MQWKLIVGTKAKSLGCCDDAHVERLMTWQNKNLSKYILSMLEKNYQKTFF
jgi:hypothetical protein